MTAPVASLPAKMTRLVTRLRDGDWNMRTPEELAECVADAIMEAIATTEQPGSSVQADPERVAQLIAHRACHSAEHDPQNGRLHGCCIVCGIPWPCEYAGTPPPAPAAEQGDETGPYPFGAGLQQSPAARYWQQRSEFWMGKAISLGWREVRDAANGEAPATQPEARGEGMVREFLARAKVPGKDYLYCIKPKELDALFAAAPEPEVQGAMGAILAEVERATRKFPTWPTDPLHAVAVVNEEIGELNKALLQAVYEPHKSTDEDVATEAIQAAAMAYRFVASLDRYNYARCEQHEQPPLAAAPGAVGVDEAMVDRALIAFYGTGWHGMIPSLQASTKETMRAALTAALAGKDGAK